MLEIFQRIQLSIFQITAGYTALAKPNPNRMFIYPPDNFCLALPLTQKAIGAQLKPLQSPPLHSRLQRLNLATQHWS